MKLKIFNSNAFIYIWCIYIQSYARHSLTELKLLQLKAFFAVISRVNKGALLIIKVLFPFCSNARINTHIWDAARKNGEFLL